MKKILYIAGGRGICMSNTFRKIPAILKCWESLGFQVKGAYGGEVQPASQLPGSGLTGAPTKYKRQWFKDSFLLSPFVQTVSEKRDMEHNEKFFQYLENICQTFTPDVIWERSYRLHDAGLRLSKQRNIPYILEWKDHLIDYPLSRYRHRALAMEKQKNRHADYIVIESEKLKNDLAATGVDKEKILVAFNAVNPNEFNIDEKAREEYRREIAVSDDEVLVGYLGSYAFYHDSQRLVLAAQRLKQQGHNNIRILMVGVGKDYNKCHALAQKLGLLDSTIIMKPKVPKEEVPQILASLDIAVLPGSTDIICPIKVQEYMAMELPAVVSDYPANREVIKDGENGVLFKPKNQKLLAEKLLYLAQDAEVRRNIGKKARQEIIEKYTWDKTWGKVLQDIVAALKKTDHSIQ